MITDQALSRIGEYGLLGAMLIVVGYCVVKLYNKLDEERNSRLNDMKAVWEENTKFRVQIMNILERILELIKGGK